MSDVDEMSPNAKRILEYLKIVLPPLLNKKFGDDDIIRIEEPFPYTEGLDEDDGWDTI